MERRLARLRWVENEQAREYSGLKGFWNWMIGKPRLTGKLLWLTGKLLFGTDKMIEHADGMLYAIEMDRGEDIISQVMRLTGADAP